MKVYPRHEYPTPVFFKHIETGTDDSAFITTQFHTVAEGEDFILDVDPDVPDILAGAPHGNLLVDIWADEDGSDWIASMALRVGCETLEITRSWSKDPRQHNQLHDLMVQRAQHVLEERILISVTHIR